MQRERGVLVLPFPSLPPSPLSLIINPLSPNSDQHQFSPNNIHALSRDKVMRFNKDYQRENALILH